MLLDKIRKIWILIKFSLLGGILFRLKKCSIMKIFVDADACPVAIRKLLQFKFSQNKQISIYFVASYNHQLDHSIENVHRIVVDTHREAADMYIMNHVTKGDIVITQDIGLASVLLSKNICVISFKGKQYTNATIDEQLFFRHINSKRRRTGQKTIGPKKYTIFDLQKFESTLNKILLKEGFLSFNLE